MGRYTLLLVLAAVAGGSYLSFNALRTQTETGDRRAGSQSAVLARQLAESGQAIALTAITKADGFSKSGSPFDWGEREYRGGVIGFETLDLQKPTADGRQRATIRVAGVHGEAEHRLRSVYDFDPMDFPGPVWLDVPYATSNIDERARIKGNGVVNEPQVDPTKNTDLGLANDGFSLTKLKGQLAAASPDVAAVPDWRTGGGQARTADLNNGGSSADDLYYQLSNAARRPGATSKIYKGPQPLSGTVGAPDAITLVEGDVTVSGTVRGEGALVVEGDLRVSGTMDWTGLVVVRSEEQHATVELTGDVTITGALVVSQEAYPPGGHIDVTVFRAPKGDWPEAWGKRDGGPSPLRASPNWDTRQPFRWFEHTHRFDQPANGDADRLAGLVRFVDQSKGDPHDRYTGLRDLLTHLGSAEVRVEFAHVDGAHGHSVYALDVAGRDAAEGTVAQGFGETAMEGPSAHRSASFRARDLRRLTVQPRSRRSLRKLWDGSGNCDGGEWPYCVGEDRWNRRGALGVRIVDAGNPNKVYYEGTVYWHMQTGAEQDQYHDDKAAWQAGVASGERPFGTDLTMGRRVRVTYAGPPIVALAETAGFKGNQVIHISTESDLTDAIETRAARALTGDATDASPVVGPDGKVLMCDKNGKKTKYVDADKTQSHLAHGCTLGACSTAQPGTPTGRTLTNPAQRPTGPCPKNGTWEWDDGRWECD